MAPMCDLNTVLRPRSEERNGNSYRLHPLAAKYESPEAMEAAFRAALVRIQGGELPNLKLLYPLGPGHGQLDCAVQPDRVPGAPSCVCRPPGLRARGMTPGSAARGRRGPGQPGHPDYVG